MTYPVGSTVVVSERATSLYLQEIAEGRQGTIYTVIHAFNDGMNTDRITLKADTDAEPRHVGIPYSLFELVPNIPR